MPDDHALPLSREEARLLAEQLAVLTKAGLPLAAGLRAAAEEMPSPRLSAAMLGVAERLEQGRSLDDVLRGSPRLMPEHMLRLIETGVRSGNLPEVLAQLVEIDRSSWDLRRAVKAAVAYPLLLLALCLLLVTLTAMFVLPDLSAMMTEFLNDFNIKIPFATKILYWLSGDKILRIAGVAGAAATMLVVGIRVSLPPQRWRWMKTSIPFLGPILLWRGIANWARLTQLMLRQGLPAGEALRLAAMGVDDSLMAVEGLRMARAANKGRSVADSLAIIDCLPNAISPILHWGEENNSLPEAFELVAEMFEYRTQMRTSFIRAAMPPIAFLCVATLVVWLVRALYGPLLELIPWLSGIRSRQPGIFLLGMHFDVDVDFGRLGTILLISLFCVFGLALWIRAIVSVIRRPPLRSRSRVRAAAQGILNTFYFAALLIAMISLGGDIGLFLWMAMVVLAFMLQARYRQSERRVLLWLLGTALSKGLPLSVLARSFAADCDARFRKKVMRLAQQLDHGIALDKAIRTARISIPDDALLALRTGYIASSVTPLIKAARYHTANDTVIYSISSKVIYAITFLLICSYAVAFMMIKIIPAYIKIFDDFNTALPKSTIALISGAFSISRFGFIGVLLLLAVTTVAIYAICRNIGLGSWEPPLVRRLTHPLDCSIIVRSLADAVEARAPIASMIDALAKNYPKGYLRRMLYQSAERIDNGADWCNCLQTNGMFSKADAGMLKSAERVGNLPWAMNALADRLFQRFVARTNRVIAVVFPLILLLFAAIVFFVSYAMLEPLADLVLSLAVN